jgi:hypothetical protein
MSRYRQAERLARYRKRKDAGFPVVISEGDSWFSYEFFPNIIDLIEDREVFAHLRLEMSGDTVQNMIGSAESRQELRRLAEEEDALFLLFSGGGNDIQRASERLFQEGSDPDECIVPEAFETLFGDLRRYYADLIGEVGPYVPIVTHGYDRFKPTNEPIRIIGFDMKIGPWIYPNMVKAKINDAAIQQEIANRLVDRFNQDLKALSEQHPDDFIYVDLRTTLTHAQWENEIHPTREGFRQVADKMVKAIFEDVRKAVTKRRQN